MGLVKRTYTDRETVITAENLNEIQDAILALEDGLFSVDNDKSGASITITDAAKRGFRSLNIYGKTTQSGTPTPDAPVDLVSAGDSGSITVTLTSGDGKTQKATFATPNGLPGVPVTSGGNYTDANGQQWICDEIDFFRGVYVKRINVVGFENAVGNLSIYPVGSNIRRHDFWIADNPTFLPATNTGGMCNALVYSPLPTTRNDTDLTICAYTNGGIYARYDKHTTVGEFVAWANEIGLKVQYVLATPIETPLTEEQLAAYAALYTYKDLTTVSNDAGAYMELEYVMDSQKYFNEHLREIIADSDSTTLAYDGRTTKGVL